MRKEDEMPKRQKLFIFDLDDTLMWNTHRYSTAFIDFYSYLMELWHKRVPYVGYVAPIQEDIDLDLGSEIDPNTGEVYGLSTARFPTSLVLAYRRLCEEGFGEFSEEVADRVYEIGMSVFDSTGYKDDIADGALDVLNFLKEQGHKLALVTKGDVKTQEEKIEALDAEHLLEEQHIVMEKKESNLFAGISERLGVAPQDSWSVGNSFRSDIQPAIEAGLGGIYIPCYTWKLETPPESCNGTRIITVPSITDVIELCREGNV